jgi:hypothetical protein
MQQNPSIMLHRTLHSLTNRYVLLPKQVTPQLERWFKLTIVYTLIPACLLTAGCDTPEGARGAATVAGAGAGALTGFLLGGRRNGPAAALFGAALGATLANRYASGLFTSRKLRFQEAVIHGDVQRARRNFDPVYLNASIKGYPPVFYAAIQGNTDMAEFLIRFGASLNFRYSGKSLAFVAASYGYSETGKVFAKYGGGTISDVGAGHSLYAANQEQQRQQEKEMAAAAFTFLAYAISHDTSYSHDSGMTWGGVPVSDDEWSQKESAWEAQQQQEADEEAQAQENQESAY